MDGGAQSGPPSFSGSFSSFVLSLRDMRSRKDLAEDWLGDKDGILVFVRRTRLSSPLSHIMRDLSLNQSGLFSVMIIVFIIGGNDRMLCNPIAENATSLTFSLASTIFGVIVRRWATRYLFGGLHRIDTRIPRHIRLQASEDIDTSRPVQLDALIHLFLPLSVTLFFVGLMIFMLHIGISSSLVLVSSLVLGWLLYVFLILTCGTSLDESC